MISPKRLRKKREALRISQRALARMARCARSTITRIEGGEANVHVSPVTRARLARALRVSPEWLGGKTGDHRGHDVQEREDVRELVMIYLGVPPEAQSYVLSVVKRLRRDFHTTLRMAKTGNGSASSG